MSGQDDDVIQSAGAAGVCFLLAAILVLMAVLGLIGCTQHAVKVTAPQLDQFLPVPQTRTCRPLNLLPLPQKVSLNIDGDTVQADAGGEQLLRGYVLCRLAAAQ